MNFYIFCRGRIEILKLISIVNVVIKLYFFCRVGEWFLIRFKYFFVRFIILLDKLDDELKYFLVVCKISFVVWEYLIWGFNIGLVGFG